MDRKWLYPYYVIVILALVLFFFGCDTQGSEPFSVNGQVENGEEVPIEKVIVGTRDAGISYRETHRNDRSATTDIPENRL
jgi:hypothetical protein